MTKALASGAVLAGLIAIGWHYASPSMRASLLGFVGMAQQAAQGERVPQDKIRRVGDMILPEDPVKRREALTGELKQRIEELKRREVGAENADAAAMPVQDMTLASTTVSDLLHDAGNLISALEGTNKEASLGSKLTERVIDRLLPAPACTAEEKK